MQALVTGATSGIGRAIALALHGQGYDVIALGRKPEALHRLMKAGVRSVRVDLADRNAVERSLVGIQPDVLVNNAGIMPTIGNFCDLNADEIDRTLAVNVAAVLHLTRLIAPRMCKRGSGHIFFTSSTAAHAAFPNMALYSASKAAIGGFAQALRLDLAPSGVRVTEIVAGRVETDLYKGIVSEDVRAAMYANKAAVQPDDVAAMVLATLALPAHVDVSRFDILPTQQGSAASGPKKEN